MISQSSDHSSWMVFLRFLKPWNFAPDEKSNTASSIQYPKTQYGNITAT